MIYNPPTSTASGFQLPLTGAVNGINQTYTWTTTPSILVVDGVTLQKTEQSGSINWTGTTTTIMTVPPVNSIVGIGAVSSGGTPAGNNTDIQINNAGVFGAVP